MAAQKKILLIGGSLNQTTMMVKIAAHLGEHDVWFSPAYTTGWLHVMEKKGLLEFTVAGLKHQQNSIAYLRSRGLQVDLGGQLHNYDLVVMAGDMVLPKNIRHKRIVLVQEGMTDPENFAYHLVKLLKLPRYLASTSTFGLSDAYVRMCVASNGYRDHFVNKGVRSEKIVVTGIPNFDNCIEYTRLPFEHSNYVLIATSDARETFKYENRRKTILNAQRIANGRQLIFKLHPNEIIPRAEREIQLWAPEALVYHSCDINPMIAHCDTLVTKFSTVVYVGIALGKNVYSDFPLDELRRMCPIQNNGTSAARIAEVCQEVLDASGTSITVPDVFAWRQAG